MVQTSEEAAVNCLTIIGPSQIGKTSLISAIYEDIKKGLEGTQVRFTHRATPTAQRLNRFNDDTLSALRSGRVFNAATVKGTDEFATLEFELRSGEFSIPYDFVDYPGGWLGHVGDDWEKVRRAVSRSQILVVITDATLIMEANTDERKRHVGRLLQISAVKETVEEWAKVTQGQDDLYLFLVPVKCETYEKRADSDEKNRIDLMNEVNEIYKEVEDVVKNNNHRITSSYQPVQTLGGVVLQRISWKSQGGQIGYEPTFKVLDRNRKVFGCKPILTAMCKTLENSLKSYQEDVFKAIEDLEGRPFWEKALGEMIEWIEKKLPIKLPGDIKGPEELNRLKCEFAKIVEAVSNLGQTN